MKTQTHDHFDELADSARRFLTGAVLFIGFFAGLMWLLRDLSNWVLAVLKASH
jgi:hypothetical protein